MAVALALAVPMAVLLGWTATRRSVARDPAALRIAASRATVPATSGPAHNTHPGRAGLRDDRATTSRPVFSGAVAAVPRAPAGWTIAAHHLTSGGRTRAYLIAHPLAPAAGPVPVLVVLQGRMLTPAGIERITGFLTLVGRAVVVYPAGFDQSWNAGYCCGGAHRAAIDDVAFLQSVIRAVVASQAGTSARDVYLVGYSNGGRMAYRMACADPRAFAGVAAVEAVAVSPCSERVAVPLIEVVSRGDPLLTIDADAPRRHIAGHTEETVTALMAHWRGLEGCQNTATTTVVGRLTTSEWGNCRDDGRVALATYHGGSHAWPRGGSGTPSAQQVIWAFFRAAPPSGGTRNP